MYVMVGTHWYLVHYETSPVGEADKKSVEDDVTERDTVRHGGEATPDRVWDIRAPRPRLALFSTTPLRPPHDAPHPKLLSPAVAILAARN